MTLSIVYSVLESLWAGWILKCFLSYAGREVEVAWTYLICFIVLNIFDVLFILNNKYKIAYRLNNAGWIIIFTIIAKVMGVI